VLTNKAFQDKHNQNGSLKLNTHIRLSTLPHTKVYIKRYISDIAADETGNLLQLTGTVIKTTPIKLLEVSKQYECKNSKCKHRFRVYANPEQEYQLPQPRKCPSKSSVESVKCFSTQFFEVENSKVCVDFQEIKIQDDIENLG
jgi:DNA helicase MCM9